MQLRHEKAKLMERWSHAQKVYNLVYTQGAYNNLVAYAQRQPLKRTKAKLYMSLMGREVPH